MLLPVKAESVEYVLCWICLGVHAVYWQPDSKHQEQLDTG